MTGRGRSASLALARRGRPAGLTAGSERMGPTPGARTRKTGSAAAPAEAVHCHYARYGAQILQCSTQRSTQSTAAVGAAAHSALPQRHPAPLLGVHAHPCGFLQRRATQAPSDARRLRASLHVATAMPNAACWQLQRAAGFYSEAGPSAGRSEAQQRPRPGVDARAPDGVLPPRASERAAKIRPAIVRSLMPHDRPDDSPLQRGADALVVWA